MNLPSRAGISPIPVLLAALVAVLSAAPVSGRTWTVRADGLGDAPTIQAGIDSAAVGDTVLVGPGTYYENITFRTKDLVVRSEMGPEATIIQGSPSAATATSVREPISLGEDASGASLWLSPEALTGTVVTIEGGQSRSTLFAGFTVTGAQHGVYVYFSSPRIEENIISGNASSENGGGVLCVGIPTPPEPTLIAGNIISDNRAQRVGGGIICSHSLFVIEDNQIVRNCAVYGDGGGIYCINVAVGSLVTDNLIRENDAGDQGGGIYVGGSGSSYFAEASWNVLWGNVARGVGYVGRAGGAICVTRGNSLISNNTIVENSAPGHLNAYGGGIAVHYPGNNTIERNIIAFSESGGGILCGGGTSPVIRNNLAWENNGGDGLGECATWWQGDGSVVADPIFCGGSSGDFSLATSSPAFTHPDGPLGALPTAGCTATPVQSTTWGRLKTLY